MFGFETPVASIPAPRAPEGRGPSGIAPRRAEPAAAGAPICPHRFARWAWGEGLRAGDAVALLVQDLGQAEAMRLGLSRLGLRVICLAGRRGTALAEGLSGAALVIADAHLAEAYAAVMGRLAIYPALWWNGPGADFASLDLALSEMA
ncbi:AMP-dependent synthetase [Methylobacterium sp. J-030]|uniref:AMP-dependent synthetase n=1 Tax=Methylobacterium sp. J-030 TaxID=2836627 RepID=UPI001FBB81EB|nr:AMP-dependent synthetase [Methylobacterium sp. J-030]MCJ2073881.1 AMP-dependent synthetase [Methylobacterium sp. J-030]